MTKRIAALLLCALALCARGAALADALLTGSGDAQILAAVFPGRTFTPDGEDFCFSDEEGTRYLVREARQFGDFALIVVERLGRAHVAGWQNFAFAVFDLRTGMLVGEPLAFPGDEADYLIGYKDGVLSVLYTASTKGQGWESCRGGMWRWDGAAWRQVWPDAAYESEAYWAFWENQKAVIDHGEARGEVAMYTRVRINQDTGYAEPSFAWEYSHGEAPGKP